GLLLYELLASRRAFHGETPMETNTAVLMGDPPDLPESVPSELRQIVAHCLEKDPANRFQSARDLCFALSLLADGGRHSAAASAQAQRLPGPTLIPRPPAKAPNDRRQSDRDLAGELQRMAEAGSQAVVPAAGYRHSRERVAWVVAAGLGMVVVGALAVAFRHVRESPSPQQVVRL